MSAHQRLRLIAAEPNVDITVQMGDGPAVVKAGFSGWEAVKRIRRKSMTTYVGEEPLSQEVPVLLDGFAEDISMQRKLDLLLSLGEGEVIFRAFGPIRNSGGRFIFGEEPEFKETIRDSDGTLLRQELILRLMEYVEADIAGHAKKSGRIGIGNAVPLTYRTVQGDTLIIVAQKLYHDWKRWKEIGRKNGIRDPHRELPPGRTLRL